MHKYEKKKYECPKCKLEIIVETDCGYVPKCEDCKCKIEEKEK